MLAQTSLFKKSSLDDETMMRCLFFLFGILVASAVNLRLSTNDQHGAPEVIGSDMRFFFCSCQSDHMNSMSIAAYRISIFLDVP